MMNIDWICMGCRLACFYTTPLINSNINQNDTALALMENENSRSKTNPMKECHGLEFRLPLMSYYTQEGFSKGALKLKLDTYL